MDDGWYRVWKNGQEWGDVWRMAPDEMKEFEGSAFTFEPVVVLTVEEYKKLQHAQTIVDTMRQFSGVIHGD